MRRRRRVAEFGPKRAPTAALPKAKKPPKLPSTLDTTGKIRGRSTRPQPKVRPKPSPKVKRLRQQNRRLRQRLQAGRQQAPGRPVLDPDVEAQLGLKYGPVERELAAQERISAQQKVNVGGWYDQYLQHLNQAQQGTAAAYGQAQQQLATQANQAYTQDEAARAQMAQEAERSAAIRGTTAGPDVAGQQAAQARRALSTSFQGLIGTQGGAATTLAGARYAAGAASKVRALEDETARERELRKKKLEVLGEKGLSRIELTRQKAEDAWKRRLEAKAFGLEELETVADIKGDAAKRRLDRQKAKLDRLDKLADNRRLNAAERRQRADLREKIRHNRAIEQDGGGGRGGGGGGGLGRNISPDEAQTNREQFNQAVAGVRNTRFKNGKFVWTADGKKQTATIDQLANQILAAGKAPNLAVAKAAVLVGLGRPVPPGLARRARRFGIKPGKVRRKKKATNPIGGALEQVGDILG